MRVLVAGFDKYEVTDDGRVISHHGRHPRELVGRPDGKGYLSVTLADNKRHQSIRIHRLVATAFIPNPTNLPCVRHLDGNPKNNRADNLAWGTYQDNENDKKRHGTYDLRRNGKLRAEDRARVRQLWAEGVSQEEIASTFDVSRPTITRLLNSSTWSGM